MKILNHIYKNYIVINTMFIKGIYEYYNYKKNKSPNRIYKKTSLLKNIYNLYTDPSKITNNIYIGNLVNARDFYKLNELDVGLIVNCTLEIPNYFPEYLEYINVKIIDVEGENIYKYLDTTVKKINDFIIKNPTKKVLVHCFAGASRSVSIVLGYLIKYKKMSFYDAIHLCKEKRDMVNVNIDFCNQLKQFEKLNE